MTRGKVAGLFDNPFSPGYGSQPPYLAGRKEERYRIFEQVGATANNEIVSRDVVIYGPRGSGKTSLLRAIEETLSNLDFNVTLELMTATDLKSAEDARRELIGVLGQSLWEALKPSEWGLDWRGMQAKWQRGEISRSEIRKGLVAKCKSSPLILLIDEAHLMAPSACRELLNEVLTIRGRGGPAIVVLAGKPQLAELGDIAQVSFLERGEVMSLDLLDEQSAGDAVRIPLERAGIKISSNALVKIARDTQGYPQFLQLWGSGLWKLASEQRRSELTETDVDCLDGEMRNAREEVYLGRFAAWKAENRELLTVIAKQLLQKGWVGQPALEGMVQEALENQGRDRRECEKIVSQMVESDFLWRPKGQAKMLPALPSFVSFVVEQERIRITERQPWH